MKYIKILKEVLKLEKEKENLFKKLENHSLIKLETNFFTTEDKNSFLKLWKEYIIFFENLQKLINKSEYRIFFVITDYNKLVIRKYLLILYFNSLILLLKIF